MSETPPKLVLASTSRYRAEMLAKCCLLFEQERPEFKELLLAHEQPEATALRLARGKSDMVTQLIADRDVFVSESGGVQPKHASVIVGSDQIACLSGQILGKPGTSEKAIEQLTSCSGAWVSFFTGLHVIYRSADGLDIKRTNYTEEFSVKFRSLTAAEIKTYVHMDQPLDCAGSFKAEGLGLTLFENMKGRDIHTLYGLPLLKLLEILRSYGINPIDQSQTPSLYK
ncbi:MAG: MAF protein [Candidatus Azotimanducaceae bacterium]|jgi:septum formation protein